MNRYAHELLHLLRSRGFIAALVAAVLVGAVPYVAVASTSVPATAMGFWFESGDRFDIELWTLGPAGEPLANVHLGFSVVEFFGGNSSPPPVSVLKLSEASDSEGHLSVLIPDQLTPGSSYRLTLTADTSSGVQPLIISLQNQTTDAVQSTLSPFLPVADGFYSEGVRLAVVWAGAGGSSPAGNQVVGCDVASQNDAFYVAPSNCSQAPVNFTVGALSDYVSFLPLPPPVPQGNATTYWSQLVEITNLTGVVAIVQQSTGGCSIGSCGFISTPGPALLGGFATEMGFLLPLIAVMAAYWGYASPRLTGTLESVLARPITRRGLFLVRYGAAALILVIAMAVEILLLATEVSTVLREPLPLSDLAGMAGGLTVAMLAMAGILFLLAHLLRSTGSVLGIGIGVSIATSILWVLVTALVLRAFGPSGLSSHGYAVVQLRLGLLAPSQFPTLAAGVLVGPPSYRGFDPYSVAGISGETLALVGVAWIVIPFLLAFWLAVTRD